ncbi:Recombination endonuclease VII [Streptosporangium canum]|uniref:Recombination endonuclease VII n=1 Tax=Streptosporangium canum TaxID=324952 RepID=A0A1I3L566_9ACTN|nr:endonuclease VII domain-containing protein [Streptosporangium canum]SFI79535.1 Recombination endonuclease VII [Streptosporangium canum]
MRRCKRCEKNRSDRFFTGPRGKICTTCQKQARSEAHHRRRVGKTYGLEAGEYDTLFAAQEGKCAICLGTRRQRLSVDHDHRDGVVRGLLCRMCNGRLLTAARDRPEVLRAAADYLERPPAIEVIGHRYASEEANNNGRQRKKR